MAFTCVHCNKTVSPWYRDNNHPCPWCKHHVYKELSEAKNRKYLEFYERLTGEDLGSDQLPPIEDSSILTKLRRFEFAIYFPIAVIIISICLIIYMADTKSEAIYIDVDSSSLELMKAMKATSYHSPRSIEARRQNAEKRKRQVVLDRVRPSVDKYDSIKNYMSLWEVESIMGWKGNERWSSNGRSGRMSKYTWPHGVYVIHVTFSDGEVWSKARYK